MYAGCLRHTKGNLQWWVSSSQQVHAERLGHRCRYSCASTLARLACRAVQQLLDQLLCWLASSCGGICDSTALQWWWGLAGLLKHTAAWDVHCRCSPLCLPHQCIAGTSALRSIKNCCHQCWPTWWTLRSSLSPAPSCTTTIAATICSTSGGTKGLRQGTAVPAGCTRDLTYQALHRVAGPV